MPSPESPSRVGLRARNLVAIWAGLLVLTAALVLFSRSEGASRPSAVNTRPSGMAAFAELLRRDGFEVVFDRSSRPELRATDLAIAVSAPSEDVLGLLSGRNLEREEEERAQAKILEDHLKKGGALIETQVPLDLDAASRSLDRVEMALAGQTYTVARARNFTASSILLDVPQKDARYSRPEDGLFLNNRFLDEYDDAAYGLALVRGLAPGKRVVFLEALAGNRQAETLLSSLGDWAIAARNQILLLFLVVIWTMGRRFGVPETDDTPQRGVRELVDAVADVFRRSKQARFALSTVRAEVLERIRLALRAPVGSKEADLVAKTPPELREAMAHTRRLLEGEKLGPDVAMSAAKRLLHAIQAFERDSRVRKNAPSPV